MTGASGTTSLLIDHLTATRTLRAVRALRRFTVRAQLPASLQPLQTLAMNLRWTWHPPTQDLFASLDPDAWERSGHDPVRVLGEISSARFAELAADAETVVTVRELADDLAAYLGEPRWYQAEREDDPSLPEAVGYFSMEFGVSEVLPNYSGGLGVLAGDHLKAASDLGVPLVAVGLLYRSGYFRQSLALDGWQVETYPVLDPQGLPLHLLTGNSGEPLLVTVNMPGGRMLSARVWRAAVGRVPLLLLDSDIEENDPDLRGVTDRLYGGDQNHRIRQEILVGIGGVRAVRAFCAAVGSSRAHRVPHQRGTRGLPGPGAHPGAAGRRGARLRRGAGRGARGHGLHHAHAGARRHRPVPARHGAPLLRRLREVAGAAARRPGRARARPRRRAQPEHVQHGSHGSATGPAGERRLEAARRGVAGHVRRACGAASTPSRCRSAR